MTAKMRADEAKRIRGLAEHASAGLPGMNVHEHLRDSAGALESGNTVGAVRHLNAAIHTLTPQSLYRHGIMDDTGHSTAKLTMNMVNRHAMRIKDIEEQEAKVQERLDEQRQQAHDATAAKREERIQRAGAPVIVPPLPIPAKAQLAQIYEIAIELSAQTGRLSVEHHPLGKKDLWHTSGLQLPAYVQNIAHALLRTGRAKTLSQAIAIARAATKKWMSGGGHVHPEVRAAAAKSDAEWQSARAKAHSHANPAGGIELVGPKGYSHGWVFSGTPGTNEHVNAIKDLADKIDNKSPVASRALSNAADAMSHRNMTGAQGHLKNAAWFVRRQAPEYAGAIRSVGKSMSSLKNAPMAPPSKRQFVMYQRPKPMYGSRAMGYANEWDELDRLIIELAGFNPSQPRVAAGAAGGGQWGGGGGAAAAGGGKGSKAAQKKAILAKVKVLRAQLAALQAQYKAAMAHHAKRGKKVQTPAQAAAAAKRAAAKGTAAKKKSTTARKKTMTTAQMHGRIIALQGQIHALLAQAAKL